MDDHDDPVADRPVQGLLPLIERSHDAKAQKGQISCLKCPRFVLPGQQCAIRTGGRHASSASSSRILFRLDLLCGGILRRSRGFFPLPEQSLDAGVASAAPKVLLGDVASPFSKGISEKQIFEVLSHVPATEHRMRGAHEIELFKKISPSVVYIQTTDAIGTGSVISDGLILTNYHVVGGAAFVGILYKPVSGDEPERAKMITARVIRVDQTRDLALSLGSIFAEGFAMTAGVLVPLDIELIEDAIADTPQLLRNRREELIDDRRFAEAIYRVALASGLMEQVAYQDTTSGAG